MVRCVYVRGWSTEVWFLITLEMPGAIRRPAATPLWNSAQWLILAGFSTWSRPTAAFLETESPADVLHPGSGEKRYILTEVEPFRQG